MSQAKTLTAQELRRVTDYVATRQHAARNRAMLLVTHLAGMRVGEVAALRICDVVDDDGKGRPYGMVLVTLYRENLFASKGLLGLVAEGISVIVMLMVTLI